MKKYSILLWALAALAAASCTEKEEIAPASGKVTREFSTVLTKTTLHTDGQTVYWEEGDAISVFDGVENNKFDILGYDNGSPSASATFSGSVDGGASVFYAVYPYDAGNSFNSGTSTVTATVPAAQTLKAGSFQSGAAVAVARTTTNSLSLHNATALLGITLTAEMIDVTSIEFSGNNNEYVAGPVSATLNSSGAVTAIAPGTGSKTVTLTGTFAASGTYYLSFIPQTFTNGVKVIVTFDGGKTAIATSDKSLATEAGTSYNIANFTRVSLPAATFAAKNSFNYDSGAAQVLPPVSYANIASITVDSAPAGWDIVWNADHFEVTPPTQAEIQATPQTVDPAGTFEITLHSAAGHTREVEIPVRLYGVNSLEDLLAFRDLHGATGTLDASAISALSTTCADYLVAGALTLNADITLARGTMYSAIPAYFIHHLYVPLNGNNRTLTADYKSSQAVCMLFQYVHANVSNLNIAGTFESEYPLGVATVASLAHYAGSNNVTIDNVNSSATIIYNSGSGGLVGGIVARVSNNCKATVSNCTFSGTINAYNGVDKLGGIIALGTSDTAADTGDRTDVDNCKFTGKINYYSNTHSNSRIGGIMGSNERYGQITDCTSSGDITLNLYGTTNVSSNAKGVGGILGRCNASNASYTMETTVNNCVFSGTITVINGPGENASFYNKIIGADLRPATQSGNDDSLGTINLSGASAGALSFNDASTVSFTYGETKQFDVTASGSVTGVAVSSLPAGWTVDCSSWGTGKVSVTAPTQDEIMNNPLAGIGSVVLNATLSDASVVAADNVKGVRLYGINNKAEFDAFLTAYNNNVKTANEDVEQIDKARTYISDYMQDDVIVLNASVNIGSKTNYVFHWLQNRFNGNNKTITTTITGTGGVVTFCQHLVCPVTNLNLAGSASYTGAYSRTDCKVASLASNVRTAMTIENVHSSMTLNYQPTGVTSRDNTNSGTIGVGGIVGVQSVNDKHLILKDCSFSGTIQVDYRVRYVGGIIAQSAGSGTYNLADPIEDHLFCTIDGCSFSGTINVATKVKNVGNYTTIGGIVAEVSRNTLIKNATSSGKINCNAISYSGDQAEMAAPIGGIAGRMSNVAKLSISDSETTSDLEINVTNLHNTSQALTSTNNYFNKIVGYKYESYLDLSNVTAEGTVNLSWYNDLLSPVTY